MKKHPCSNPDCERHVWTTGDSKVNPCCMECRRTLSTEQKVALGVVKTPRVLTCQECDTAFTTRQHRRQIYCSIKCFADATAGIARSRSTCAPDKARRADRERVAPGLRKNARSKLLCKWKRQGRTCSFCPRLATTIDHVIPLARGGTNYEGNLIPCCKACNSSKSDLLTSEWRYGKAHGGTVSPSPWLTDALVRQPKPEPRPKPEPVMARCFICTGMYRSGAGRKTCGGLCSVEYNARAAREAYRARVGLPPTWDDPAGEARLHLIAS